MRVRVRTEIQLVATRLAHGKFLEERDRLRSLEFLEPLDRVMLDALASVIDEMETEMARYEKEKSR